MRGHFRVNRLPVKQVTLLVKESGVAQVPVDWHVSSGRKDMRQRLLRHAKGMPHGIRRQLGAVDDGGRVGQYLIDQIFARQTDVRPHSGYRSDCEDDLDVSDILPSLKGEDV